MSRLSPILFKIKKCLNVCGTSISDLLYEYDRSSTGIISSSTLTRALNGCGANLSAVEIQDLEIEFKYGNGISIPALIAAVEISSQSNENDVHRDCFNDIILLAKKLKLHNQTIVDCLKTYDRNNRGCISANDFVRCFGGCLESRKIAKSFMNPETHLISIRDVNRSVGAALANAPPEQIKEMPKSVRSLISLMIKKGIDFRQIFQSYDKVSCGKIPAETFAMSITSVGGVQMLPQEVQEITRYYFDSNGLVNYLRFCQDVDLAYQKANVQIKQVQPQKNNVDAQKAMQHLKKTVIERRISISEIFPKTKTGKLSQYVFSRILSQNNLGLTNQEIESITHFYTVSEQSQQEVDCQKFLSFFAEKKVEKSFADINLLLQKIAHISATKHSNLKGTLLRFDRDGSSIMPAFQFIVALQKVGISLGPHEINEICRVFPGNFQNSVSLQSFLSALHPYLQKEESNMISQRDIVEIENKPPTQPVNKTLPPQIVLDIVNKVSYHALRKEIKLIDDFRNIDKFRHNTIPKNAYFEYITSLNAGLSIQEIRILFECYIQNNEEFDYVTFCRDANICVKSRVGNANSLANAQINDTCSLNNDENISPELKSVLYKIRALEIKKMLDVNDLFFPYDQMKNGTVSCKYVNSIFANMGLLLKGNEYNELIKYYQDSLNKDMFHYRSMSSKLSTVKLTKESVERILYPEYFEAEMERELYSVRPEIKEKLHVRRKNVYMVYANANGSTMTENDFFNRLSNAGIIIMKSQREAIVKYYSQSGSGEINFKKFCDDVENSSPISV